MNKTLQQENKVHCLTLTHLMKRQVQTGGDEVKTAVTMKSVPPSAGRSLYCHMDGLLFSPRHVISCQYHLATRT